MLEGDGKVTAPVHVLGDLIVVDTDPVDLGQQISVGAGGIRLVRNGDFYSDRDQANVGRNRQARLGGIGLDLGPFSDGHANRW